MLENKMVLDEWWPEYHDETEEDRDAYLDWCDHQCDQARGK